MASGIKSHSFGACVLSQVHWNTATFDARGFRLYWHAIPTILDFERGTKAQGSELPDPSIRDNPIRLASSSVRYHIQLKAYPDYHVCIHLMCVSWVILTGTPCPESSAPWRT